MFRWCLVRGGGKSWFVRTKAIILCYAYAGIKVLIVRKTYPELQENHIIPLCTTLKCYSDPKVRLARYNESKKHITFPNGSRILFRYLDNEKDAERFQGTETDVLFIDEAEHQTETNFRKLTACVRGANAFPKRTYITCNAGSVGHEWIKRLFIDRKFKEGEDPEDYVFIKSLVTDNEVLMRENPDYFRQLQALPPRLRRMWLDGDWSDYEGKFFEDFREDPDVYAASEHGLDLIPEELREQHRWCHVIPPIDLSKGSARGWNIYRSYDFGYGKPFSCAWWAVDYDGVIYRIMELYGCTSEPNEGVKWTPDKQFAEISNIEQNHPWLRGKQIEGVADPAIWDASRGESIAETAMRYGVYFQKGDNNRIAGWMQVHYRFQFDENGYARMYIFENCKAFIRTIPLMMYDEHKVEDLNTDLEDHVADEVRYFCMSRPIQAVKPVEQRTILSDPLNMFKKEKTHWMR